MPRSPCSDLPPVHGSPERRGIHSTQGGVAITSRRIASPLCSAFGLARHALRPGSANARISPAPNDVRCT